MKLKLTLEYDGAAFSGWQYQSENIYTVQGELQRALGVLFRSHYSSHIQEESFDFKLTGSGRTDRGVHAKAQVATFFWPDLTSFDLHRFRYELNGVTSKDLCVKDLKVVDNSFCARFSPHIKRYSYAVHNSSIHSVLEKDRAWWLVKKLDFLQMYKALEDIRGTHDFSSFRAKDCCAKTTIRTLNKVEVENRDRKFVFIFEGSGFLKNMIRILVGTLAEVGKGNISCNDFKDILDAKDRSLAGPTAPAHGLCLEQVRYEG